MTGRNVSKRDRYAFAWTRIRQASQAGFHLEAVTICESIISDRLLSYLQGAGERVRESDPFAQLITGSRKRAGTVKFECRTTLSWESSRQAIRTEDLFAEVDGWRKRRNELIHGVAKSAPGQTMKPSSEFVQLAKEAAQTGERLARLVIRWHQQQRAARSRATSEERST